jgi:hypothetical protein
MRALYSVTCTDTRSLLVEVQRGTKSKKGQSIIADVELTTSSATVLISLSYQASLAAYQYAHNVGAS